MNESKQLHDHVSECRRLLTLELASAAKNSIRLESAIDRLIDAKISLWLVNIGWKPTGFGPHP